MNSSDLPADLREQFTRLERRLWRIETIKAVSIGLGALILSYILLFISDRLWETPVWLRTLFALGGLTALIATALWWMKRWVFQRRDLPQLAVLVQRKYRRLGDRLLGIVELANEKEHPTNFSPVLYKAAIQQVAADASQYEFSEAVDAGPARFFAWTLGGLLVVMSLPLLALPNASWNAFLRWIAPVAGIVHYTLVQLDGLPGQVVVPHGEPFDLDVKVAYRSFWQPSTVWAQIGGQLPLESAVADRVARLRVPAQTEKGTVRIKVGDARGFVEVLPTHRPTVKDLSARITLPEYLKHPATEDAVKNGAVTLVEGSEVALVGKANRPLSSASLRIGDQTEPLQVNADTFLTAALGTSTNADYAFSLVDSLGLTNAMPWRVTVQVQQDAAPVPEILGVPRELTMLESEMAEIKTAARDDFGLLELGIRLKLASSKRTSPNKEISIVGRTPQDKELQETFSFSPSIMRVPVDSVVELQAYATDYYPDREPAVSPIYRILVVGNERHAEMIRQRLEGVLAQVEEVSRAQEKLVVETTDLKNLENAESLKPEDLEKNAEKIAALEQMQKENAALLENLAQEGMKALREAFRNPNFTEDMLKEWARNLREMQQLSEGQMQQASQSLAAAQKNSADREENLEQALGKEKEAMNALEEMQKRINQGMDNLQAMTLAQRLRKLSKDEKEIEGRLQRYIGETIGLLPQELPDKFREVNADLGADQSKAQNEAAGLHAEISRFFERTQRGSYGQVNSEMKEARVGEELDRLRGLILENISMQAMNNLSEWAKKFTAWADQLEPQQKSSEDGGSGGGSGGGEGEQGEDMMKHLIGLLRLRDGEIKLREKTRLVESQKKDEETYAEGTKLLAETQQKLRETLEEMQKEIEAPMLKFPLQEAHHAMTMAESLLNRPQTDEETRSTETKAIEVLADSINLLNEQSQKQSSSSSRSASQAAEMAFLMQMMAAQQGGQQGGMQAGDNPGGNRSGGDTDSRATPVQGDTRGRDGEGRAVERASGRTGTLPSEFREALQNYFEAIEKQAN